MIWLTPDVARGIVAQARDNAPNEACGVLLGRAGHAPRRVPLTNIDPSPQTGYAADPSELATALMRAVADGEQLQAIYHSHPNGPAIPSRRDIADWGYPDSVMLIAGRDRDSYALAAWKVAYGRVERVELHVGDIRPVESDRPAYSFVQRAVLVMAAVIAAAVVVATAVTLLPPPVVP
ncbi:MAG: M67 family metallopeptidase [Chloroflexi bacterium]|nr:M67 family metallopeptidase [Chloroflexota bacterium]